MAFALFERRACLPSCGEGGFKRGNVGFGQSEPIAAISFIANERAHQRGRFVLNVLDAERMTQLVRKNQRKVFQVLDHEHSNTFESRSSPQCSRTYPPRNARLVRE